MKEKVKKLIGIERIKNNRLYFFMKILLVTIFSTTIFLGSLLNFSGDIFAKSKDIYFSKIELKNIVIFVFSWIITYLFISILEVLFPKIENTIQMKKNRKMRNIKVFFFVLGALLILWSPYYLSYFPGGVYSDTTDSINQALGEPFNNHNPILYALILRIFLTIGMKIQGIELGLELFTVFQILVMAITFAYFVYWLYRKRISTKYLVVITLFFGVCRLIPLYAVSIWKDTPFCIALFWYIIFIAETVYQDGKNLEKVRYVFLYLILMILVAFLRNNGFYIAICTTIILLLIYRKRIVKKLKKFAITSFITIAIIWVIQSPIYNYYGLSTEFVENLGVPIQQIAYVIVKEGNITEEQKEFINELCPIDVIKETYTPCVVDTIKWNSNFNNEFLENNKGEFFKIWFQIFLKNPVSYLKAYLINTMGFWNVTQATMDAYVNPKMWPTIRENYGKEQNDYIEQITGISIRDILKPNSAVSSAIYLFIMLLSMLMVIYKKEYGKLVIYIPGFYMVYHYDSCTTSFQSKICIYFSVDDTVEFYYTIYENK